MDYSLALQLKEAGFPLKERPLGIDEDFISKMTGCEPMDKYMLPTLEELIEACGGTEFTLHKLPPTYQSSQADRDENGVRTYGGYEISTKEYPDYQWWWSMLPREAVARLWLELNRK